MEAVVFAFFAFACFCVAGVILKGQPIFGAVLGLATSICSGISMYLFWQMLEESGRDSSYIGPWGHPMIPTVYVTFILLGLLLAVLGFVRWRRVRGKKA